MPGKVVFERILTKALCREILGLMLKKKLGNFSDWINSIFSASYTCRNMNIFSPQYSKYSFLDVAQQILANLEIVQKSIMKTQKSLTEVIVLTLDLWDWIFWMLILSKKLLNRSVLFLQFLLDHMLTELKVYQELN